MVLLAHNTPEFVLTVWACWRIGSVPTLANRWWSPTEIEQAMVKVRPAAVVSDATPGELPDLHCPVLTVDLLAQAWSASVGQTELAPPLVEESDPAAILFTSGSTGAPKAVVLSHRSVIANQHNLLLRSGRLTKGNHLARPGPVTLVCTPLFHIGGLSSLMTQLLIGGTLVLTGGRFDAGEVLRLIEQERVELWGGVPTMALRVLEHPDFARHDLSSLRSFPLGGAPVPHALFERMRRQLPQLRVRGLANNWGMTESGGFLTVAGARDLGQHPDTVGRPYPTVEIRIDASGDGDGDGEILVRSPTLMSGYLASEEQPVDADGWLHTGDVGRFDGELLFLTGRSKDIVIRGGENIATAHVEQALTSHPAVSEAAVVGVAHDDLGEELAAVVCLRPNVTIGVQDLRNFLRGRLAYFEVPTRWDLSQKRLPTVAGEKVDKHYLRSMFTTECTGARAGEDNG